MDLYIADTMIKNNPETIAAEEAAKIAEHEVKKELKDVWKMVMDQLEKTAKYLNLPPPAVIMGDVTELKNEVFGVIQKASEDGITSVIGRPLKIIRNIIDFSNNILHPTKGDSKTAKLITDLKTTGLPINLVLSDTAFYPNKKETSAMGKLLSVTQDQAKMEDKLASMIKKSNSKSNSKSSTVYSNDSDKKPSSNNVPPPYTEQSNSKSSTVYSNDSDKKPSSNNVPPPYTEQSKYMAEMMFKKMMAEERMRQLMAERLMNYRRGMMFGGKRKKEKEPIKEIQELFGMLINHRVWVLEQAKNINKNSKPGSKKRTIKKKKMIKNPKKKGTKRRKGSKRK